MGIEEVKKEIVSNATAQAKEIIKEGEKEKKLILDSAEDRISSIKETIDKETKSAIEQYSKMMEEETSSFLKKQKLLLEKEVLNEVFERTKEELKNIPQKKRENHIKHLLGIEPNNLKSGKIYCSKKDIAYLKKFSPKETDILGGVVIEDKEGEIRVDASYETFLEEIKKKNLSEISKILFR